MSTGPVNAKIRVRPLRFGFALNPNDRVTLRRVIETNTCLWGGVFQLHRPRVQENSERYRDQYLPGPATKQLMDGLVEASPTLAARLR
jgi:hypothetical protein